MTKLEQAARQALETLEVWSDASASLKGQEAITALREALAEQAEQEPVAWARTSESGEVLDCISNKHKVTQPCTVDYDEPLYAAPVRTKDLTDEDIQKLRHKLDWTAEWSYVNFARAVIAADRRKNK